MQSRFACAPLIATALVLFALPANALEPKAVADAIGAAVTKGGHTQATYESVGLDGGNVVIKGFALTGTKSSQVVRFAQTVVESPSEDGTGLFHSPRITFSDGAASGEENGSVASVTLSDVTVLDAAKVEGEGFAEAILYRAAEVADAKLLRDKAPREVSVERVAAHFGDADGDGAREVDGAVEGLKVTADVFTHRRFAILSRARLRLEELGYQDLIFDIKWHGLWNKAAGTMTLSDSSVDFRDKAVFSAAGTVGNLPDPRVLNDSDAVSQIAKLQFHDFVARYQEKAFAGDLFDLMAKEQELSRSDYLEQLSQALPFLLASLTHPAFRDELIAGLRAFFKDPHSLTFKIDPQPPISGSDILSLAKSSLGELPDRLKASVIANGQD